MTFQLVSKKSILSIPYRTMIDDDFESSSEMEESGSDDDEMELEVLLSVQLPYRQSEESSDEKPRVK